MIGVVKWNKQTRQGTPVLYKFVHREMEVSSISKQFSQLSDKLKIHPRVKI